MVHKLHGWFIEGFAVHASVLTVITVSLDDDMSTWRMTARDPKFEDYGVRLSTARLALVRGQPR